MMMTIYGRAWNVLMRKPLKLWGISWLCILLTGVLTTLCGVAIPVLSLAISMLMGTSMTMIFLKGYRGEEIQVVDLFFCFKDWQTIKRVLLGMAWMTLWVFLWCLIPIVGPIFAIIRIYEYRLTPYILVTEPEIPVTEAIKVSKIRTEGFKLQMFWADIAVFVGFFVACLVLSLLSSLAYIGVLFALALVLLYLAFYALCPLFLGLVQAAFYEEINRKTRFCVHCGAPLAEGANFCANCGNFVQ